MTAMRRLKRRLKRRFSQANTYLDPPAITRYRRRCSTLKNSGTIVGVLTLATVWLFGPYMAPAWILIGLPLIIYLHVQAQKNLQQFEVRIGENDYKNCLTCAYPLTSLPDQHKCPECGIPFEIDHTRRVWQRYFREEKKHL